MNGLQTHENHQANPLTLSFKLEHNKSGSGANQPINLHALTAVSAPSSSPMRLFSLTAF